MGSDNEYEHQSEWRKTGGISIRQSSEFFQIPNKPIEISISELQVSKHGNLYIVSNVPIDNSKTNKP